jgi:anti-sigma regulatory factor (Ser/Thr protein kinase)
MVCEFAAEAGAGEEQVEAIRLATSEAITNAVQHAYPGGAGEVQVTLWLAGEAREELWLLVGDSGCGLDAGEESEGLGLGLGLITRVTDGFSIVERAGGGIELQMRFALDA